MKSESSPTLELEEVLEGKTDVPIRSENTLPGILFEQAREHPDKVALRWKRYGVWQEYTWSEWVEEVEALALALESMGLGAGDVLFTVGDNRPQQLWFWQAIHALGGHAAPHYPDVLPEVIKGQLNVVEASVVYAEDQQVVDKVLEVWDETDVETIIYNNPKGMYRYDLDEPELYSYEEILEKGESIRVERPNRVESLVEQVDPSTPAMLTPTSGTTGAPKRVRLSHSNFINHARAYLSHDPVPDGTDYFSFLPMAWVGEQMFLCTAAVYGNWVANFPEQPETLESDMREIGPEVIFGSPEFYESWIADIQAKIENTSRLKKLVYNWSRRIGKRYAEYVSGDKQDEDPPAKLRALHWIFYWIAYRPILDKLGLKRAKKAYTGGAPLGEDQFRFYHSMGVPLKQLWGQTEVCGFVTTHQNDDIQVETCGTVFPNVSVGLLKSGELVVKGPVVTDGYYNQPEKSESAFTGEWLHTDDFGAIAEDGHVIVHDRMDDVLELGDGTTVTPVNHEAKLKFNSYVKSAMVVGDGRPHLTAILNIRFDNVAEWADQNQIQYNDYADLAQHPAVLDLLTEQVEEVNEELPAELQINRFISLFKEFDADDGEITRTKKLRRDIIVDRYEELIEAMYNGDSEIAFSIDITYEDGTVDEKQDTVHIVDVQS